MYQKCTSLLLKHKAIATTSISVYFILAECCQSLIYVLCIFNVFLNIINVHLGKKTTLFEICVVLNCSCFDPASTCR